MRQTTQAIWVKVGTVLCSHEHAPRSVQVHSATGVRVKGCVQRIGLLSVQEDKCVIMTTNPYQQPIVAKPYLLRKHS